MPQLPPSIRHSIRRLRRGRGVTAAAILTLTLGLAAATAVFAVVRTVLLRPLPYPAPDRLVSLAHTLVVGGLLHADQSDATLLFYGRHNHMFAQLGGYQPIAAALAPDRGVDAERVAAARVTAGFFPALGLAPLRGRLFNEADDQPFAAPVVVLGERVWTRKYGRDPSLLQHMVIVDGVPREVIGIVPASVRFPAADTELWVPMQLDPAHTESATLDYMAIARLRDGASIAAAADDLQTLLPELPTEFPGRMTRASIAQTRMRVSVRRLDETIAGDSARLLWLVFGAAAFVLAIACANVANLFLVRAESRQQGIAVQRALGASSRSILAEFAADALLVCAAGGVLGTAAAYAGVRALASLEGIIGLPRLGELTIDAPVLGVTALMTIVAAAIVTILPAWRYGAASISLSPGAATQAATAARERYRARYALVVVQVALSLVLLAGSGLLATTVWRLRSVEPGFAAADAMTFRLALPAATYPDNAAAVRFATRTADAMAGLSGVRAAGVASKLPLDDRGRTDSAVFVEDRPLAAGALPGIHPLVYATPSYFAAAGIPLLSGRAFAETAPPGVTLEAVVSRAFADRYWRGASPIGRRIRTYARGPFFTIVGVAGDVHDAGLDRPVDAIVYCPLLPPREDPRWSPRDLAFLVRTVGNDAALAGPIRSAVHALDPSVPAYRLASLSDIVSHAYAQRSFTLLLIGCAALAAVLLAAIGLYGVMAFVVTLRRREIGIRLAIGARPADVSRMVWRQGAAVALLGIAAGLGGAIAVGRALAALLFEVSATDVRVLALSSIFLMAIASAASWIPARRAASVDPSLALRAE